MFLRVRKDLIKLIGVFCFLSSNLFCGSVRLYNDSAYRLKAVIQSRTGMTLGEMIVNPGNVLTWDDSNYGQMDYDQQEEGSQTPYTVSWFCLDGTSYSVCYQVASAATVSPQGCIGARQCKSGAGDCQCPGEDNSKPGG
jgi:hypothetical protein